VLPIWNDSIPKCRLADNLSALLARTDPAESQGSVTHVTVRLKGHLQS
jgi:hypothetical protein